MTDPKGLATTYTLNGFGELTTQVSPDTGTTAMTVDNAGNVLTRQDARGVTATFTYDALNRVATASYPAVGADPAETVTYTRRPVTRGCREDRAASEAVAIRRSACPSPKMGL